MRSPRAISDPSQSALHGIRAPTSQRSLDAPESPKKRGSATVKSTSSKSARPRHQQHSQGHRRGLTILNKGLKKDQPDLKTQRAVISARSPGCSLEFRDGACEQRSQLAGLAV